MNETDRIQAEGASVKGPEVLKETPGMADARQPLSPAEERAFQDASLVGDRIRHAKDQLVLGSSFR